MKCSLSVQNAAAATGIKDFLINTLNYVVEYDRGVPVTDYPITYKDFADNTIETICWLTNERVKTRQDADADFISFALTDDILNRMFADVIGEAG